MKNIIRILFLSVFSSGAIASFASGVEDAFTEELPASWSYESPYAVNYPSQDEWWKIFQDPLLDSLINEGENRNFSLKQALKRIEVSRNTIKQAKSGFYPQFTAGLGWTKSRVSGLTMPGSSAYASSYFSGNIDMSWEIDVFGKIAAKVNEEKAGFKASKADYAAVWTSLCAEIATQYFSLRTLQSELDVIQAHIESQEKVLKITEARHEAGLASMLDVSQAQTDYFSMKASCSSVETQIATTINAIAVLVGEFPQNLKGRLEKSGPLPVVDSGVQAGVPADLLRRRPDIVEAEYNVASYACAFGVAKKDFLPTLSLTGNIGTESYKFKELFTKESFTYSIAPSLTWTIFDGLSRDAAKATAKEEWMISIDEYNATVLTAVEEVENTIVTYNQAVKYEKELEKVVDSARQTFQLALDRYKQGLDAFINVADAQMTMLQYSSELQEAKGSSLTALVSLYKALGGGWSQNN